MTGLFGAAPEPMSLWAMLGGGLLGCLLPGGGKRKKRSKSKTYARTKRRKRAVT